MRFNDLHSSADGLISNIKGTPGTAGDYAAQGLRAILGFVKDAFLGIGELAYEGGKLAVSAQQNMTNPNAIYGQLLDAQILAENVRLGNVTTGTMANGAMNTATNVGKAIIAPVAEPLAKGQYVEAATRGILEVGTLPLTFLKSGRVSKVGDALNDGATANKATEATNTASDANKAANASDTAKTPEPKGPSESGNGGKIKQKIKSLRRKYLGKTPGKNSKTGREVQERMRKEGKLRDGKKGPEFKASDGEWYPLKDADMSHHPTDAVSWWNKTGRQYGAKSPEVRKWMLDSKNYTLDHFSINRSAGAKLTETYLPPLK